MSLREMKFDRRIVLTIIFLIEIIALVGVSSFVIYSKSNTVQAQETDFTVIISKDTYYYKDNTSTVDAYLYWVDLNSPGSYLTIYGNTGDMSVIALWDATGNLTRGTVNETGHSQGDGDFYVYPDRIAVQPRTTELYYHIEGLYHPDYFIDTNFIVIFDTFWAQFSYITPEGDQRYAPVTYHNKQILPEGAGLVSYAPTDSIITKEGDAFGVIWDYEERAMDPFHEPLTYEITYNFDPIYLQFTEQMYENQSQVQEREQIDNLLDLLRTYFKLIAFFAVAISIIAALYGYLRAKRKFKSKLNEARSMPKKMLRDIERETDPKKRVSSLFSVMFLFLLISPAFTNFNQTTTDVDYVANNHKVTVEGNTPILNQDRNINYVASVDLGKDGIAYETVKMEMPFSVDNFSIWVDTTKVIEFRAYNELSTPISYQQFDDRFLIRNVPGYIYYEILRPYVYYNNSNILVYLDYFWLLFLDPELQDDSTPEPEYSKADISYTITVPQDAIVYSASPENYLALDNGKLPKTGDGRTEIKFIDNNRAIDPYHDLFSSQVTFSYIDVIEAIENQSARFEHFRVETEITKEQQAALNQNLIFISLLGLIAPVLAFLLTYFIIRRRMIKKIQEEEQKYEMLISVESLQIDSIKNAQELDISEEPWKAMLGGYWELLGYLSRIVPVNLLSVSEDLHESTIRKYIPSLFITETLEILSVGRGISNNWMAGEPIYYTKQQSRDYLESVMKLMENMEKWRKEQQ